MPDNENEGGGDIVQRHVDKVSVKLPPFWAENPETWFVQVEAQFEIANITAEQTKFNYLAANCPTRAKICGFHLEHRKWRK